MTKSKKWSDKKGKTSKPCIARELYDGYIIEYHYPYHGGVYSTVSKNGKTLSQHYSSTFTSAQRLAMKNITNRKSYNLDD